MSQIYLVSLVLMATVPALILGYLWISDQNEHFNWQMQSWRESDMEARRRALEREVDAAIEYIEFRREELQQQVRRELARRVDHGISVIDSLYQQAGDGDREALLQRIRAAIEPIRFDGSTHYFLHTLDGRGILTPADPHWEGRDVRSATDPEGLLVARRMVELARDPGYGYVSYWGPKPSPASGHYRSLSYIRAYPELGIYLGATAYLDDALQGVQDQVRERFSRMRIEMGNPMLFVTSYDGVQLVNAYQPEWLGRHLGELHDAEGKAVFPPLLAAVERPEGEFLHFSWRTADAVEPVPALTHVRGYDEWRWIIGAGVFLDGLEALLAEQRGALRERASQHLLFISLVVLGLIALAVLAAHWLARVSSRGFDTFARFFAEASRHSARIDETRLPFSEFERLAEDANRMLEEQASHEQELKLNEQRFKMALDASRNHLWDVDLRAGNVAFSPGFYRLLGFEQVGASHRIEDFAGLCHPDDRLMIAHAISTLVGANSSRGLEFRLRDRQGRYRWFLCRGDIVEHSADGRPLRALGTITDISARKRMEEELVAARIAAEDANHAKSQFLSSISHELRTPLNGVLGYAQILLRDEAATAEQRLHLEAIESCGQHLLTLINDVLDLAKIESGNLEVQRASCDLHGVLRGVNDIIRQRAESKGLGFRLSIDAQVPQAIRTDEVKLRQILVNLLGNAVKFTVRGGVELVVAPTDDGGELCFRVRDTGIGIEPDKLRDIFQPFRQVVGVGAGGTGLGLAISLRLCEAMGGTVEVDSEPGKGSCFSFTIPLEADTLALEPTTRREQVTREVLDTSGTAITVLVADDNPTNRQVLAGMLRASGVRILEAVDGREALAVMRAEPVSLVLMDVRMPVMDGFEATREIRRDPALRDVVVIAVSASVFPEVVEAMREAGCNDFINKPVRVGELLQKVREHLGLPLRSALPRAPDFAQQMAAMPAAVVEALREALAVGDIGAVEAGLTRPELGQPGLEILLAELRRLLRNFDLDAMTDLVDRAAAVQRRQA